MSDDYEDIDRELSKVHRANEERLDRIEEEIEKDREETRSVLDEADALLDEEDLDSAGQHSEPEGKYESAPAPVEDSSSPQHLRETQSWGELVEESEKVLDESGIEHANLASRDLLSDQQLDTIDERLTRPLYERLAWDRWDYLMVFGFGLLGGVLDIVVGTPGHLLQETMADKNSWIGSQMEKVHSLHADGAPIDYTGPNFGGEHHRGLSPGHDLMRFVEGIRQFKEGEFRGVYFENGEKIPFSTSTNSYGTEYAALSLGTAVWRYAAHMFCDFFSSTSLPIPGTSILRESSNREVRVLAERELYQEGFNLRHVALQVIPVLVIEAGMHCYCKLRYRKDEGAEEEAVDQKISELKTTAHSISLGFNLGKIVVTGNPFMLNVPQVIATGVHAFKLTLSEYNRNSFTQKINRNVEELDRETRKLEQAWEKRHSKPLKLVGE